MSSKKYFDSDEEDEFEGFEVLAPEDNKPKKKKQDSDSDNERIEESEHEEDNEDETRISGSDSAPEDVTFDASKDVTLQRVRQAMQQIQSEKQKYKQKRKQHMQLYKAQKEQKLAKLEESRLPDDFLKDIDPPENKRAVEEKKARISRFPDDFDKDAVSDNDSGAEGSDEADDEDFLAFEKESSVHAVCVNKDLRKKRKNIGQSALDFRQNWLYGNRLKRQTATELKAMRHKQSLLKHRGKAATKR